MGDVRLVLSQRDFNLGHFDGIFDRNDLFMGNLFCNFFLCGDGFDLLFHLLLHFILNDLGTNNFVLSVLLLEPDCSLTDMKLCSLSRYTLSGCKIFLHCWVWNVFGVTAP